MTEVAYVSEQDFQNEVLDSSSPVLVDFTAVWCGPCKMVDPIIKQLADEWAGRVKVVKCDADQNPNLLIQYGIMGIPTVMLFKSGKLVERSSGYLPKEKLLNKLNPHL
jgi:thioredoxin 1